MGRRANAARSREEIVVGGERPAREYDSVMQIRECEEPGVVLRAEKKKRGNKT